MENEIEIIEKAFNDIEKINSNSEKEILDAINYVISQRGMDYSNIKKLLSDSLKQKVEEEAMSLNLLRKKKGNKLPL